MIGAPSHLLLPLTLSLLPVIAHLLGQMHKQRYFNRALKPRTSGSLGNIFSFPFVHVGPQHLLFNCIPLAILGSLIALKGVDVYLLCTAVIWLIGGWGAWLFSSADRVAGASGLVFGYWGFIIASAFINRDSFWVGAAALTLLSYAGLWSSLIKLEGGVSWAGHFWGLTGGITAALIIAH